MRIIEREISRDAKRLKVFDDVLRTMYYTYSDYLQFLLKERSDILLVNHVIHSIQHSSTRGTVLVEQCSWNDVWENLIGHRLEVTDCFS